MSFFVCSHPFMIIIIIIFICNIIYYNNFIVEIFYLDYIAQGVWFLNKYKDFFFNMRNTRLTTFRNSKKEITCRIADLVIFKRDTIKKGQTILQTLGNICVLLFLPGIFFLTVFFIICYPLFCLQDILLRLHIINLKFQSCYMTHPEK